MGAHVVARRVDGYVNEVDFGRGHQTVVDEPPEKGGTDTGPGPTEVLAASLAGCTAITIELYAERKGWELPALEVVVDMRSAADATPTHFAIEVALPAGLDDEQRRRLMVVGGKCPVHKVLERGAEITIAERAPA